MSNVLGLVAEMQWGDPGVSDERLIAWAIEILLAGLETPSLVLLAGLTPAEYRDARDLFQASLAELGYEIPDRLTLALYYARCIAQDVVEGTMGPDTGGDRLADLYGACWEELEVCDWDGLHELHHLWHLRSEGWDTDVVAVARDFLFAYLKMALVFILRTILDARIQGR